MNPVLLNGKLEQFMPRVNGVSFRCDCGCNVFHKPDDTNQLLFVCNSCGAAYQGEYTDNLESYNNT